MNTLRWDYASTGKILFPYLALGAMLIMSASAAKAQVENVRPRIEEQKGGFSYTPPPGFEAYATDLSPFAIAASSSVDGRRCTLVFYAEKTSTSLGQYSKDVFLYYEKNFPAFKPRPAHVLLTDAGEVCLRMAYEDSDNGEDVLMLCYFFSGIGGAKIVR